MPFMCVTLAHLIFLKQQLLKKAERTKLSNEIGCIIDINMCICSKKLVILLFVNVIYGMFVNKNAESVINSDKNIDRNS